MKNYEDGCPSRRFILMNNFGDRRPSQGFVLIDKYIDKHPSQRFLLINNYEDGCPRQRFALIDNYGDRRPSQGFPPTHTSHSRTCLWAIQNTTACEVSEFCAFLLVARDHESISVNLFHAFITLLKLHTFNNFHYIKNIQLICHISNNTAPINSNLYNGLCFKKKTATFIYTLIFSVTLNENINIPKRPSGLFVQKWRQHVKILALILVGVCK